jgi:amidase
VKIPRITAAGRSLATGALLGLRRGEPGRLRALDGSMLAGLAGPVDPARAAEFDHLVTSAGVADLAQMMSAGQLTSEELTTHLLARALRLDPALSCLIALNPSALDEARAADARRASGEILPLLGIPVTVKDNIETAAPMPTTAGAALLAEHTAAEDAPVVTALRAAGAVILGKANLSEFAGAVVKTPGFSAVGGQTANPYGAGFTPGGSSSGSAVSVAAGLAPLSVGTETSGSLIAPAAFNGLVGMKPSRGVLATEGIVPLVRHQDSAGPLAHTVADATALMSALSGGRVSADLTAAFLDGIRAGVLREDILAQRTPFEDSSDNVEVLARIEAGLRAAGAQVIPASVAAEDTGGFETDLLTVVLGGLTHDTVGYLARCDVGVATLADLHAYNLRDARHRMPKGQFFLDLALARNVSADAYDEAAVALGAVAERTLEATFEQAGVDVLISVTNLHSPLYASAGWPAVTVPVGLRTSGMPTGLTLIGRRGADAAVLGWAHAFEAATRLRVAPELG